VPPPQGTLSLYDDQLENAAEDWSWATVDLANATPVHAGAKSIKVTAGSFEAFRIHFHSPISTASYNGVTFWMNGGAAGGQPLVIAATVNDTAQAAFTLAAPAANTWQKYTVTVAQLGLTALPNFDGFWIQNNSGAAISPFFIDDIDLVGAAQQPLPVITSFNPTSGKPGDLITITGSNFPGVTEIRFNGAVAIFIQDSPTQASATVPAGATTGPISVKTADGTGFSDSSFIVVAVTPPPTITSINPTSARFGDLVVITGSNLGSATQVKFNGGSASFIADSATQISAIVPTAAEAGPITVITPGGSAVSATLFFPDITPRPPVITSISPASGMTGDSITITGAALDFVTEVKFNGTSAVFTINSATELDAKVPAGAATGPITAISAGGTATSTTFTVKTAQPGGPGTFQQMHTDDGGWFTGFAIHSSGRIYGRTDIGGLYRSDNHGDSWQFLSGDMTSAGALMVQGVAVAANDANVVYQCVGVSYTALANQGIWKTTDGGATWNLLKGGIHFSGNDAERWGGECIAIRPGNDAEIWAGSRGDGLWRSRDGGNVWLQVGAGTFAGAQFTSISLPPAGRSDIWVGASGFAGPGGLWVSVDEGASWAAVAGAQNGVAAPQGVWHITREPNGKVLVAGGNATGSVLYEFNSANWNAPASYTWTDISWPGIDRSEPAPLVAALSDGRIVSGSIFGGYSGGPNSLRTQVRSVGGLWTPIDNLSGAMPAWQRNPGPTLIEGSRNALVQDPSNANRWFMAGGYGPFRTSDGGKSWQ